MQSMIQLMTGSIFSPEEVAAENEVKHNCTIEILYDMMRLLAMMQQKD